MKVKFVPQNVEFEIKPGQTVMDLAHEKGVPIRTTCNGLPSCAECRVRVVDGDWNVNPPSRKELNLIGTGYYIDQRRLSCQMLCFGDIVVDTTEQLEKEAEGPVTKKFLTKVHKETAAQSHSLGGVMLEESGELINSLKDDVPDAPAPLTAAGLQERQRGGGGGRNRGRDRGGRGGGGGGNAPRAGAQGDRDPQQASGGGGAGGERSGSGRRRRRGGRGRGGGGGNGGGGRGGPTPQ
jgi:2Fe-2S ferredoxin